MGPWASRCAAASGIVLGTGIYCGLPSCLLTPSWQCVGPSHFVVLTTSSSSTPRLSRQRKDQFRHFILASVDSASKRLARSPLTSHTHTRSLSLSPSLPFVSCLSPLCCFAFLSGSRTHLGSEELPRTHKLGLTIFATTWGGYSHLSKRSAADEYVFLGSDGSATHSNDNKADQPSRGRRVPQGSWYCRSTEVISLAPRSARGVRRHLSTSITSPGQVARPFPLSAQGGHPRPYDPAVPLLPRPDPRRYSIREGRMGPGWALHHPQLGAHQAGEACPSPYPF